MSNDLAPRAPARASATFWATGAACAAALGIVYVAAQALLLTFGGVLFGTAWRGLAEVIAARLGWRRLSALALCISVSLALVAAGAFWVVPHVADQAGELVDKLRNAYESLRESATAASPGAPIEKLFGGSARLGQELGSLVSHAAGFLASAFGAAGSIVFVGFVALYVAIGADAYHRGIIRLVPPARRDRAAHVLSRLSSTLRRWLLGRMVSMLFVGAVTALGLWLMNVPLPLTLGALAGLLGVVPNFGPLLSVLPATLLAFSVGPWHIVYVLALYLGINLADGYALTPWLQQKAVALPPALILTSQVVFGALWGVLGVAFATPLTACLVVLVRELYVKPLEA